MFRKTFTFEGRRYDVTAKTEAELYEKIANKKRDLKENRVRESEILTKDYLKIWLETCKKPYVTKQTASGYRSSIKNINEYIGNRRLKDVTASDVQKIISEAYQNGRSKSYIDKIILTLKQAFFRACVDKKIRDNPTLTIIKPAMEETTRRSITDEERAAILHVAETNEHGRWIRALLYLGFRPSETGRIKGKHVDAENKRIFIDGMKSAAARRWVPVPDVILPELVGFAETELLFPTRNGNAPDRWRMQRWWKAFKREVDIYMGAEVYRNKIIKSVVAEDLTLYCLRHTYGTDHSSAGVPIEWLCKFMGHSKIEVTQKYYIDERLDQQLAAQEIMSKWYQNRR